MRQSKRWKEGTTVAQCGGGSQKGQGTYLYTRVTCKDVRAQAGPGGHPYGRTGGGSNNGPA